MSNHTPAPWRVGSKYACDIYADRAGHAIARAVNPQHEGECEANARIIAAAPELLAALQGILTSLVDQDDEGMIEHADQMIAARAAIAKATGSAA